MSNTEGETLVCPFAQSKSTHAAMCLGNRCSLWDVIGVVPDEEKIEADLKARAKMSWWGRFTTPGIFGVHVKNVYGCGLRKRRAW